MLFLKSLITLLLSQAVKEQSNFEMKLMWPRRHKLLKDYNFVNSLFCAFMEETQLCAYQPVRFSIENKHLSINCDSLVIAAYYIVKFTINLMYLP